MPEFTLDELARAVGGEVIGNAGRAVSRVAPLDTAGADAISIVASRRYLPYVADARAAAVLVSNDLAGEMPETVTQIRVPDVHAALVEILGLLHPPVPRPPGVHPTALI
jgi:UDP-3-O-[3-hydroxymyristoyl] glucosamine N-acyltransferase